MILDHLPHTATAKRRTRTQDTLGSAKDSYTTVWSDRACWRQPVSDSERMEYEKRGQRVTHKIYFAADPELDEEYMLIVGGDTMSVRSVSDPDASVGLGILWRVMVELE